MIIVNEFVFGQLKCFGDILKCCNISVDNWEDLMRCILYIYQSFSLCEKLCETKMVGKLTSKIHEGCEQFSYNFTLVLQW